MQSKVGNYWQNVLVLCGLNQVLQQCLGIGPSSFGRALSLQRIRNGELKEKALTLPANTRISPTIIHGQQSNKV